jgi:hypothetical protein
MKVIVGIERDSLEPVGARTRLRQPQLLGE